MHSVEERLQRLERINRRLLALWGITLMGALAMGAQVVHTSDILRTRRLEVVDERGVPIAVIANGRGRAGGEIVLRDREGEKRLWLGAEPGGASLGLQGGAMDDPSGTAALRADGEGARFGIIGAKASVSASVQKEQPKIATTDNRGRETFAAPWK